jgi:hypothetical protein
MQLLITEVKIIKALKKAKKGIKSYSEIMEMFSKVNVAPKGNFQRKFNSFYRIRQRPPKWYRIYYQYMERMKGRDITFHSVLHYLKKNLGKFEPSFSSKLLATHNPNMPIWDQFVLANLNLKAPGYNSKDRFKEIEEIYQAIQDWYAYYQKTAKGKMMIRTFDKLYPDFTKISNVKKIDFVLWKLRK